MAFLDQHDVEVMDWPAMNADLNPIELVWDEMSIWIRGIDCPPSNVYLHRYLKTLDFSPFLLMPSKANVKHEKIHISQQHATIHIAIAVEQINSQTTKPHGAGIGRVITDVMLLPIARVPFQQRARTAHNTLRPRQNGRHFQDDTFKYILLNENFIISAKMSLRFVPYGPINNIPALVQAENFTEVCS